MECVVRTAEISMDASWFLAVALLASHEQRPASTEAQARALVEKAVAAQGGLERLTRARGTRSLFKGTFQDGLKFDGESFNQNGGKLHLRLTFKDNAMGGLRVLVLDGTKGWLKANGVTNDLDSDFQARVKTSSHVDRVSGLTALLKDKGYSLSLLGESKVKDIPALGVKVARAGLPDVSLFFDKKTGLLLKAAHRSVEPFTKQEVAKEMYFADYRTLDPAAEDEKTLTKAGRPTDAASLLAYLKQTIPDDAAAAEMRALVMQLGDQSFGVREKASAALVRRGIQAAALLQRARRSPDAEVAERARRCLDRIRPQADFTVPPAALRLLALRKPPGAVPILLEYLPWAPDEASIREAQHALVALAQAGKQPEPTLLAALKDSDPVRREAAAAALTKDGGAYLKRPGRRLLVEGLRLPHTVTLFRDGKKELDIQTFHYEFFNRFEDALFERP
jgi:hypothetical protein